MKIKILRQIYGASSEALKEWIFKTHKKWWLRWGAIPVNSSVLVYFTTKVAVTSLEPCYL